MKCEDIIKELEEEYPLSCAEDWDNPGLLVGRSSAIVQKIYVTLDVTDAVVEEAAAWGADLILSHHPLIFSAIRQINDSTLIGRRLLKLMEHRIAVYAMHTNFDVRGMADLNERQLGLTDTKALLVTGEKDGQAEGIGRVGQLPHAMTLADLCAHTKKALGIPDVRCYGNPHRQIRRAAISGGSGKSVVADALALGAEALITGDIDYHTAIDAAAQGLTIIDAGHYGTEYCFVAYMADKLRKKYPQCQIKEAPVTYPYCVL
jgi:dinuclear metal center YbgI/SA1388 family protein